MREIGATRSRLPDGSELELGPEPAKARSPRKQVDPQEAAKALRERRDAVMFGSSSMRPLPRGDGQ